MPDMLVRLNEISELIIKLLNRYLMKKRRKNEKRKMRKDAAYFTFMSDKVYKNEYRICLNMMIEIASITIAFSKKSPSEGNKKEYAKTFDRKNLVFRSPEGN